LRALGVQLVGPVIDTADLSRSAGVARAAPGREPSLEVVAATLGLDPHAPHHALGDALTTAEVFLVLATRLNAGAPRTAGSLAREPVPELPDLVQEQLQVLRHLRPRGRRVT
jgi:DNA polymerase-3 subunit epsilon